MFKMRIALACLYATGVLSSCTSSSPSPGALSPEVSFGLPVEIEQRMERQESAWNSGDIGAFMQEAYWPNDSMLFIGKRGMTWGYDATRDNYLDSYPNIGAMGTLKFDNKHWKSLGSHHGLLVGEWLLIRGDSLEDLSGYYSLIWEEMNGRWVIIADHSS